MRNYKKAREGGKTSRRRWSDTRLPQRGKRVNETSGCGNKRKWNPVENGGDSTERDAIQKRVFHTHSSCKTTPI